MIIQKIFFRSVWLLTFMPAVLTAQVKSTAPVVSFIPQPNDIRLKNGFFTLSAATQIVFSTEEQRKLASWFSEELQKSVGLSCLVSKTTVKKDVILLIEDASLVKEGYSISIEGAKIVIKASSSPGYFYAFQTILQMLPITEIDFINSKFKLNQLTISDQPRFKWRGAVLDISRHFFGPEPIRQLIDQMAAQKMNRLHLHLTDDTGWRIEIKEYPKLHEIGSRGDRSNPDGPALYLTEAEAREITAYANERQIMIIPEVDVPGHFGAVAKAYPAFSGGNNTMNIANEDAIKMIETVILRLADIFNTSYVHFGSDEVRHHNWEGQPAMRAKMDELGLKNQREFEGWFDRRMADFIVNAGLKPVAWDEAAGFGVNTKTTLQWWRGEYPEVLYAAAERGHDLILSPVDYVYLDYPSSLEEGGANWEGLHNGPNSLEALYNWKLVPANFSNEMAARIIGIEAGIWTEFIDNQKRLEYMIYPRLAAIAEKAWTYERTINWESFQKRLDKQYLRYKKAGINYRMPTISTEERKKVQPEAFDGPIK